MQCCNPLFLSTLFLSVVCYGLDILGGPLYVFILSHRCTPYLQLTISCSVRQAPDSWQKSFSKTLSNKHFTNLNFCHTIRHEDYCTCGSQFMLKVCSDRKPSKNAVAVLCLQSIFIFSSQQM